MSNKKRIKAKKPVGYAHKVAAIVQHVKPGQVGYVRIAHDDHCPRLKDKHAACECNPDVRFVPVHPYPHLN